ncbi:MAG: hypothetical protein WC813_04395 [Patescibacteria group bacterium]|jgi:hypothetical protein
MSTASATPDPAKTPELPKPVVLKEGQKRALLAWTEIFMLRNNEQEEIIERPKERRQLRRAILALTEGAQPYGKLPDMTEARADLAHDHAVRLTRVIDPDPTARPSKAEREESTMFLHGVLDELAPFLEAALDEGFKNVPMAEQASLEMKDWIDDNVVTNGMKAKVEWAKHTIFGAPASVPAKVAPSTGKWWWVAAIATLVVVGAPLCVTGVVAYLAFRTGRTSSEGKKKKFSLTQAFGQLLKASSLTVGVIVLATWLRPGFSPLAFWGDVSFFAVWASIFFVLVDDPWTVQVKDIYVGEDGKKVVLPTAHDEPKAKPAAKDAHGHAKEASPSAGASTAHLIEERQNKQYLTVQGETRAANLKVSMGATLVGLAVNVFWAMTGEVVLDKGLFVAAWFFLLTILTVAQYFNGYILPVLVQDLITALLGGSPKAIVGMAGVALFFALFFSQAGQRKLVGNLHAYTDNMLEADSGRNTYSLSSGGLPLIARSQAQSLCLADKVQMENDRPGYCARHPEFKTCTCD